MTRDEIIKMAEQARFVAYGEDAGEYRIPTPAFHGRLERFAALVVSHHVKETRPKPDDSERKWLQQIAYQHGGIGDLCETEFEFGAMVSAAEREACAKQLEAVGCDHCAAAIRARGEK